MQRKEIIIGVIIVILIALAIFAFDRIGLSPSSGSHQGFGDFGNQDYPLSEWAEILANMELESFIPRDDLEGDEGQVSGESCDKVKVICDVEEKEISGGGGDEEEEAPENPHWIPGKCELHLNKKDTEEACKWAGEQCICGEEKTPAELKELLKKLKQKPPIDPFGMRGFLTMCHELKHIDDTTRNPDFSSCDTELNAGLAFEDCLDIYRFLFKCDGDDESPPPEYPFPWDLERNKRIAQYICPKVNQLYCFNEVFYRFQICLCNPTPDWAPGEICSECKQFVCENPGQHCEDSPGVLEDACSVGGYVDGLGEVYCKQIIP